MLRQFSPIPLASNSLGSPEGSLRRAAAIGVLLLFASFWILGGVAVASAAPRDQGPEVIVKLRAPGTAGRTQDGAFRLGTPEVDRVLGRYQAQAVTPAFPGGRPETQEIRRRYGLDRYYKIRLRPGADARAAAAEMRRAPEVELATEGEGARLDADASTAATAEVLPDDPSFGIQWGLRNTGADIGLAMPFEADADIDATEAWDLTTGSSSVTVALIGSGIDYAEPELAGRFFENAAEASGFPGFDDDSNGFIDDTHGWDWIEGDANPGHLPDDPLNLNQATIDLGATRVASVIGAQGNNAVGMSGIDWGCRILALRLTSGSYFASYSDLMNSYLYAAELGARVIVTSIVTYDLLAEELTMQRDVMAAAQAMGAVVVAPIGTSTVDGVNPIYYPAPLPGVLGVATSQGEDLHCDTGRCAHWSIAGPHVALAAPGRRILTINPVAGAPSTLLLNSGGGFAAAHVAGTAALALSANPALTSEQLSSILKYSADDQVGDPIEDVPGWDPLHGFGRLNSRRAVEWATASPVDLSPPGVISIAPAALTAAENSGAATLTLSRSGGSHGSVSVSWGTADGTAQNGVDYGNYLTPEQLVVTWADGDATDKSISVPLIDNALVDGDRAFTVGLAGPTGGASIAVGASESIVTIADDDNPPAAIDPIGDVDTSEGATVTVPVHASDAEGDAVSLTAQLPAFGVLNAPLSGAGDLTTTITLTPGYADAGSHFALVQEAGGASESFGITVSNVDRAPAVTAPASVSGYESVAIAFTVAAGDPDGEAVTNLATTALPLGATFTPAADNSSGDFAWTPAVGQAGPYSVTFQATAGAGALTGSATTAITVSPQNLPPVVVAPASLSSPAGITINFAVTATDPEGEVIERLVMSGLTKGSTFTTSGVGTPTATGTFTWTPPSAQTRTFTFTASNGCGTLPCLFNGSASTVITVTAGVPTLSLSLSNYTVNEAAGTATITVTRGVSSVGTVTVDYATTDGTAVDGIEYTGVSGTLTFPDGAFTSRTFTVPILDDLVKDGNKQFGVVLGNPTGGAAINRATATVTIQDDESVPGLLSPSASAYSVSETAGSVVIAVERTLGSDGAVSVNYSTSDAFYSEAIDGIHFLGTAGTLSWADGDATPKSFTIPIIDNSASIDGDLRFRVVLSSPTGGALIAPGSGADVTILDDGTVSPSLTVTPLSHDFGPVELGAAGTTTITVQNTGGSTLNVAAPTLASGAVEGYSLSGGTPLAIAPGAYGTFTATFAPTALGGATGSISVTSDGGSATVSLAGTGVDTTPPSVTVVSPAGGEVFPGGSAIQIEWTASDNHQLSSFQVYESRDGGVTFPYLIVGGNGNLRSFLWTPPAPVTDITAALLVRAQDAAGNVQTATSNLFTILHPNTTPAIDPIAPVTLPEGSVATVPVHASDAEGDAISLSATLPSFGVLNMPQSGMGDVATSITLSPGFSDAGSHSATVTEAGGASVTFGITVSNTDQGLVLTAPASLSAAERTLLTVDVTASDPDGEPVTSLTADLSGLPAGHDAAFAIVGDPLPAVAAAGRLTWTPGCDMAGTYTVTFSGTSGNLATAVTTIAVADVGTPPSIGPIADPIVAEASLLDVAVSASDAEGDPIALSATLPVFGSFVDNGGGNGTITLAPGYLHSGTYPGSVTATEGCDGSASLAFTITVLNTDRPVTLAAAASEAASEGVPFSMTVLAHDDDGETIALSADLSALPAGNDAAFGDAAVGMLEREGTLTWTPTYDDAGSYPVTFTATAGLATATATTTIAVANTNRMPSVSAPASRSVNEGSALSIAISASDPDGAATPLTLSANFSGLPSGPSFADNGDNTGLFTWTPTYADASGSPYFVTFSASDGSGGSGSAVTQILVLDVASAIAFPASKSVLRLSSGKPTYCAVLEPVGGSFVLTDVDWASVRMNSTGTGTVSSIGIDATKPVVVGDQNGNLTQDATFCFGKTELRNIFAFVSGRQTVPVTITGSLMGGATFIASLNVEVIGTGGALTASVSPNPLNPEAVLTFEIASATSVRVTLHDIQGRLVRSLANESMAAGWHDLRIDGRDDGGRALRSGVYFYRIETGAGVKTGQLTILK